MAEVKRLREQYATAEEKRKADRQAVALFKLQQLIANRRREALIAVQLQENADGTAKAAAPVAITTAAVKEGDPQAKMKLESTTIGSTTSTVMIKKEPK
jgi:hypothetical protein